MSSSASADADAAFHEWKQGGCRYLCAICDALTNGLAPFTAHLASAHGISSAAREEYYDRFGHPRVQTEFVRCRLCACRVVYDHLKLKVHMRRFHGDLDLRTYYDRHVYKAEVGGDGEGEGNGPGGQSHGDSGRDGSEEEEEEEMLMVQPPSKEEEEEMEEEMAHPPRKEEEEEEEDADYDDWVRGCVYECRFCLVRHHRSSDLRDHLIDRHRQEAEADSIEDLICTGTILQTYTSCNLCDDIVLRESNELAIHFHTKHDGMDPRRYFRSFHNHSADRVDEDDDDVEDNEEELEDEDEDDKEQEEEEQRVGDMEEEQEEKADVEFEEKQRMTNEEERRTAKDDDDNRILQWNLHSVIASSERALFDDHECRICGVRVRSSTTLLNRHLRGRHGINVLQYCQVFVLVGHAGEDACCYRCRVCWDHFAASRLDMVFHLAERHQGAGPEEEESLEPWACSMLECHLCGERVRHDGEEVRAHAAGFHQISLEEFFSGLRTELRRRAMTGCEVTVERMSEADIRARTSSCVQRIRWEEEDESQSAVVVTHEVTNLATFSCQQCDFSSSHWGKLRSHLSGSGRCSSQLAGRRLSLHDFLSPGSPWHRCLLCGKRVICTVHSIGVHVKHRHRGFGMQEYRDRVRRAHGQNIKGDDHQGQAGVVVTDRIANLAIFSCRRCDFSSSHWEELRSHLSGSERCSSQLAGRRPFPRHFVSPGSAWHGCVLCGKRIICTVHRIGQHVSYFHGGLGMQEYRDRVRRASKKSQKGKKGSGPTEVPRSPPTGGVGGRGATKKKTTSASKEEEEEKAVLPAFKNLCLYRCLHCVWETDSWSQLVRHARDAHPRDRRPMYQTEEQWTAREVLHRCLLCGKKVQHDEGRMRSHLKRKHTGVNLRRYDGIRRRRRK